MRTEHRPHHPYPQIHLSTGCVGAGRGSSAIPDEALLLKTTTAVSGGDKGRLLTGDKFNDTDLFASGLLAQ